MIRRPPESTLDRSSAASDVYKRQNEKRIIQRFPAYQKLAEMAAWIDSNPGSQLYVSDQYLIDLVVWYHLGWMAETVRRGDQRVRALQDKAQGFTVHERRELLQVILEQLQSVIPRFSRLAKQGRVELAMSPYAHPILPLLLDISAGQQAQPDALRPAVDAYPGGRESARWHLRHGREVFEQVDGNLHTGGWKVLLEILGRSGDLRIAEVPFTFRARRFGETKMNGRVVTAWLRQLARLRAQRRGALPKSARVSIPELPLELSLIHISEPTRPN